MCGIGGSYAPLGKDLECALDVMLERLHHRGPDDRGRLTLSIGGATVGMCATRLAIRDVTPTGHQPMAGPTGAVIVFNGEIYNADELRSELAKRGWRFAGTSDTEVVLRAWEEWGDAAFARLRGMFGLAIADPQRGSLTLARDALGIKPLYVANRGNQVSFSSEIRALTAAGLASHDVSLAGLDGFLGLGAPVEPDTILADVRMLAAGTLLEVSASGAHQRPFFSLDAAFQAPPRVAEREVAEAVCEYLRRAVTRHLISDAPIGMFLSGGLDSTALVALAADSGVRPTTCSVVFREPAYSEKAFIDEVVKYFDTDHREIELSADAFLAELPNALSAMDQPTVDGLNTFVVSGLAQEAGLAVALSGLGGDELFAGYELFHTVPRLDRMAQRMPRLPLGAAQVVTSLRGSGDRMSKLARWLSGERLSAYALQRELLGEAVRSQLLPGSPRIPLELGRVFDANGVSQLELTHFMRNLLLRDSDVLSMAHSLELRVPLLDQDLVELVAGLPASSKMRRGVTKPLLQAAVGDLIPPAILSRDKAGFTLPFDRWLRRELKPVVRDTLLDRTAGGQVADVLDSTAVEKVWNAFADGRTSWSRPWALYVAKVWGEQTVSAP